MNRPLFACLVAATAPSALAAGLAIMVPAYFYPEPGGDWERLAAAARRVPIVAILNPSSGPGTAVDSQYVRAVANVRNAGGRVTGYVSTDYGRRSADLVKADIRKYHEQYTLDGFFLDEMSNDGGAVSTAYYAGLYEFIRNLKPAYHVTGNPGTQTQETYVTRPTADTVVTFENGTGYAQYVPSTWTRNHPAHRFCHLLHSATNGLSLTNAVQLAQVRNAGFLYVTDDVLENPWDRLPVYWDAQVNLVEAANRAAAESRPPTLDLKRTGAGQGRLEVNGSAGRYVVSRSLGLPVWSPLTTNLTFTGQVAFEPVLFSPAEVAFFRARVE